MQATCVLMLSLTLTYMLSNTTSWNIGSLFLLKLWASVHDHCSVFAQIPLAHITHGKSHCSPGTAGCSLSSFCAASIMLSVSHPTGLRSFSLSDKWSSSSGIHHLFTSESWTAHISTVREVDSWWSIFLHVRCLLFDIISLAFSFCFLLAVRFYASFWELQNQESAAGG